MLTKELVSLAVALLLALDAHAQQPLAASNPIARSLGPGKAAAFTIALKDGDYVEGAATGQRGLEVTVQNPDGSVLRRFTTRARGGTPFAFAAEGGGRSTVVVTNASDSAISFQVVVEKITPLAERLAPEAWVDSLKSPRIETLRTQINSGDTNTDRFWREIAALGTPLVEPFGTDGKYYLVTFLWRAVHDTRNVIVLGSFIDAPHQEDMGMHRISGSDVWYLTVKLPARSRFVYDLSPNDPITWSGPRAAQRAATRQLDPLNRNQERHACGTGGDKFGCRYIVELPGAVPQPWLRAKPGTPEGRVERGSVRSEITGIERTFSVYAPAGYSTTGPANDLVLLFDGDYWFPNNWNSDQPWFLNTLNGLIAERKIPPVVVVFVNNDANRSVDLAANTKFADYVAKELVPWVRARYHVTNDPGRTVIGGYSAGGLQAAYTAYRHSSVFGNMISQSGAFWWAPNHNSRICSAECRDSGFVAAPNDYTTEPNYMAQLFLRSPKLPLRFHLDAGIFEVDRYGKGGDILEANRQLRDILLAKGYPVHYQEFPGGHDGVTWRGAIADALIALLGNR